MDSNLDSILSEGKAANDDNDEDDAKKRLPDLNLNPNIELTDHLDTFIIKKRIKQALTYLMESIGESQILAQAWVPIKSGNRYFLMTSGQPFAVSPNSNGLLQYRAISQAYMFSTDGEMDGLIARVYRLKLPEWTPDVQYYSSEEYRRVKHAQSYYVHGTLALPVFEPTGKCCIGVLELVMTYTKINYAPLVVNACKALEAVNLRSSDIFDQSNIKKVCSEGRQNALVEILEVLAEVCETYELPLAQTWVPWMHTISCLEGVCLSTANVAFYVVDAHMWRFREACNEHRLQRGQGVVGRAFSSRGLCFREDITRFSKIEYPLVHYAKMFGLGSSFAICLKCRYTGEDDYVLEFFLPNSLQDSKEKHKLLHSIFATMKRCFRSLMFAYGRVLEEKGYVIKVLSHQSTHHSPSQ